MAEEQTKYTLWTIPKSDWSQPMQSIETIEENREELVSLAKQLDDTRLNDRLRPFDTPVTQDTLNQSVGQK